MSTVVKGYLCWRCGAELTELRLPVSRRDECVKCRAEIHVCRQCEYYDANVADACREDRAETVSDKERANFCDYFKTKADAYQPASSSRSNLARRQAEALFGESGDTGITDDPAQTARDELKRLFGEEN